MKPRRERIVSVRLTNDEFELLEKLTESQNVDKADILRSPLVDELNRIRQMERVA